MSLVATSFDNVHLVVQSEGEISAADWTQWLASLEPGRMGSMRLLVESYGGAPDALQRRQFVEMFRDADIRVAVLTDSLVARGVVTALAWLGLLLRAFPVTSLDKALEFLGLTPNESARAERELLRIRNLCLAGTTAARSP